ncbi:uncharacterized protein LOC131162865 [Malania oleifera]|uniref:uncharacterized protein LOC131162865 n=1 Tax=Malania oleifera TaxID=397392 RepID=UPI0025ADD6F1|nr:uncharacterized protein LOC131162865 [Malania oleifera]
MKAWKFQRGLKKEICKHTTIWKMQDFITLVDKATVVEESLQKDLEVEASKKRRVPPSSSSGLRQCNWKKNNSGVSQSTTSTPVCPTSGRPHSGKCLKGSEACFRCGWMGHQKKDCRMPMNNGASKQLYGGGAQAPWGGQQGGTAQARVYSLTPGDAENARDVITGTICMLSNKDVILFNSGAMHSFISRGFVKLCGIETQQLDYELVVTTPSRREVVFGPSGKQEYKFVGSCVRYVSQILSTLQVSRLLLEGFQGYPVFVKETPVGERELEEIPVVCEFPDVFPKDLSELPLDREVDFGIELVLGTTPISKALYRMTPAELRELKEQLQELLKKGCI